VWEQGGSFRKAPVVDLSLSSDEGDLIADVSWDEEFARRLFGELNHDLLGLLGDGKIIILSDSDEKKRRCTGRRSPTPKLHHLLLQDPCPQPPPPMMLMVPTRVIPLIR
jgi:hypothetical protein